MRYIPVLPFDSDHPEFARGFEAGRVWEMLRQGMPFEQIIHTPNAEMAVRMAESLGAPLTAEVMDDDWMMLKCGEWEGEHVA